jgi:hypothetical protein
MRFPAVLLAAITLFPARAGSAAEPKTELDLPGYIAELDRWDAAIAGLRQAPLEAEALRRELPPSWAVRVEGRRYDVSTIWLRARLEAVKKNPKSGRDCDEIQQHLQALRAEALRLSGLPPPPGVDARAKLDTILQRPEFRTVHGPTRLDQLRERIRQWVDEMANKLFGGMQSHPMTGRIIFWSLIAALGLVPVVWMVRRLLAGQSPLALTLEAGRQTAKTWQERAREAFAAAARGDYREATRLAYWAGVYRLEELGLWKTDRTRTHREYLRLLPSNHPQHNTFSEITRHFELAWYAKREISADRFGAVVKNLERMGCVFPSRPATGPS